MEAGAARAGVGRGRQKGRRRWGRRGALVKGVGASPPVVDSSSEASSDGEAKGHPNHRGVEPASIEEAGSWPVGVVGWWRGR